MSDSIWNLRCLKCGPRMWQKQVRFHVRFHRGVAGPLEPDVLHGLLRGIPEPQPGVWLDFGK
jgi:hypothetical protein